MNNPDPHAPANPPPPPHQQGAAFTKGVDRRHDPRFQVDGGGVEISTHWFEVERAFTKVRAAGVLGRFSRDAASVRDVCDISRGGLCFESDRELKSGHKLTLQLHVPEWSEPLELIAEVSWVKPVYVGMLYKIGVRFAPFGEGSGHNPAEADVALSLLEARHTA